MDQPDITVGAAVRLIADLKKSPLVGPEDTRAATCRCGKQIRACQCHGAVCYGWIHVEPVEGVVLHGCMTTPGDGRGAFPA